MDHLIRYDTIKHVTRDGEHIRHVTASTLEVEATQLHLLVDVHVRQQFNRGVLREMERSITRATLVVGERENCVLGRTSGIHERDTRFFYK
jgi:hypothetical protein